MAVYIAIETLIALSLASIVSVLWLRAIYLRRNENLRFEERVAWELGYWRKLLFSTPKWIAKSPVNRTLHLIYRVSFIGYIGLAFGLLLIGLLLKG